MISIKKRTDLLVTQEQKLGARNLHAQLEHSLELEVLVKALPGCKPGHLMIYSLLFVLREARLSPYAVSTGSSTRLKRPKSAVLSQRGQSKSSAGPPQTVIGWADKTDWTLTNQSPKQRTRPVSAPATRNR